MGIKKKIKLSPPPIKWRKPIQITFILLCLIWTLGFIRTYTINAPATAEMKPQVVEKEKENPAASVGAQTFATNFIEDYYTWETKELQKRSETLAQYMRDGLEEDAGLRYDGLEADSIPKEVEIINIEEGKENHATITFHVAHTLEKEDGDETEKVGTFNKYIKVPIRAAAGGYVVNEIPTFTHAPEKPHVEEESEDNRTASQEADRYSLESFLSTFLKVYVSGTKQELEYYTDDLKLAPVAGDITFEEVESFKVYEGKEGTFDLEVNAIFQDKNTKGTMLQRYEMNVKKMDGRWIIKNLK